jgi:hypothetical protein
VAVRLISIKIAAARRLHGADDLITAFVEAEIDGEKLQERGFLPSAHPCSWPETKPLVRQGFVSDNQTVRAGLNFDLRTVRECLALKQPSN